MPISHTLIESEQGETEGYLLFLHGILGSRSNWRSIAKRVMHSAPEGWGAALVDLRMHGDSQDFTGPHTINTTAEDLQALSFPAPVRAVLGHSFGGKVSLAYAANNPDVRSALIVDSNPGMRSDVPKSENTIRVLDLLDRLPKLYDSRDAFVSRLTRNGIQPGVARWLAMNLKADGPNFVFRLDLVAIRSLLIDYFKQDLWSHVEQPRKGLAIHLLIAENSTVFSPEDQKRALSLPLARTTVLKSTGHWVHVEQPKALIAWVMEALTSQ